MRRQVLGITAQHLKPGTWFKVRDEVGDGAFRRLAQKVDLELLARLAKSDCLGREPGRFDCTAMDWFLERARAPRRRASPAGADPARPPPARARRDARPARRARSSRRCTSSSWTDEVTTLDEAAAAARPSATPRHSRVFACRIAPWRVTPSSTASVSSPKAR